MIKELKRSRQSPAHGNTPRLPLIAGTRNTTMAHPSWPACAARYCLLPQEGPSQFTHYHNQNANRSRRGGMAAIFREFAGKRDLPAGAGHEHGARPLRARTGRSGARHLLLTGI